MFSSVKISLRLGAALLFVAVSTALIVVGVNYKIEGEIVAGAEQRELRAYVQEFKGSLHAEAGRALTMADMVANIPLAQKAFAARDRDQLMALFAEGFPGLKKEHGVRQFQFHTAPATSFLRIHKLKKFGDDLSGFRKTVVQTNRTKQKISGLEVGVAGLGMRGVTPMFNDGKHTGSVEFGLSFGQPFFDEFKKNTNAEATLLVLRDGKFSTFASTYPKDFFKLDSPWLKDATKGEIELPHAAINGVAHALMATPIMDYSGKALGVVVIAVDRTFFEAELDLATKGSLIAVFIALLSSMVIAFFMNKSISKPIVVMTAAMNKIAKNDLETHVPAQKRNDEIGEMAHAVQVFKENAIRVKKLEEEHLQAEHRANEEKRQMMLDMASDFETNVGGIVSSVSAASTQLQSSSDSMASMAQQTSSQSGIVSSAAEEASINVQTVASAAEELSASISEISNQVSRSTKIADDAVAEVEGANEKVQGLAQAADKIGEVVAMITDIADQTNLLALNATIEAARAGEAGKGFAVVASEVKNLANQTAKATEEISTQISGIQGATQEAVAAISSIGTIINQISENTSSIAVSVEEQGAATQEIARNVELASSGTREVSETIQSVTQVASESGSAATEIQGAATELSQQSELLRSQVDNFLMQIRNG